MGIKIMGISAILALFQASALARYLSVAGVCLIVGFAYGYKTASNRYAAAQVQVLADNQKKFEAEVVKNNQLSAQLDAQKGELDAATNALNQQATKIITRTIYKHVCFDADGLRTANSALTRQGSTSSQFGKAVP